MRKQEVTVRRASGLNKLIRLMLNIFTLGLWGFFFGRRF